MNLLNRGYDRLEARRLYLEALQDAEEDLDELQVSGQGAKALRTPHRRDEAARCR